MKISVYVPCHNNESTIGAVLLGLRQQTRPADEFLFVDDRCTDASPRIAREHGFEVLLMPGKQGLGAGRNCALAHAVGDILLGVDADVVVDTNYLEEMEKRFDAMSHIAAIGGRMDERYTDTPADLWRAVHMCQHLGPVERTDPRVLVGCNMACRTSVLRAVGGWNAGFTQNFEDIELSARIKRAGYHQLYAPACHAWHLKRDTTDSVIRTAWHYNYYAGLEKVDPHLANIDKWAEQRLPFIWASYCKFRLGDMDHPSLRMISLKAAWAWVIRDLHVVRKSEARVGEIRPVVDVARAVVTRCGMNAEATESLVGWLTELAVSLEQSGPARPALNQDLANLIYSQALESIPDAHFWENFPM